MFPLGPRRGISSCMMPRPELIHCTSPGPIRPSLPILFAVGGGAFKHVGNGLDAAVWVIREAADGTFERVVEGKMIEKQEGVEKVARFWRMERSKRTPAPSIAVCGSIVWEIVLRLVFMSYMMLLDRRVLPGFDSIHILHRLHRSPCPRTNA